MHTKIVLAALLLSPLFASTAFAQAPSESLVPQASVSTSTSALSKENSVNVSPLGVLSGSYGVNYERLVGKYHGFLVEGNFSSASDSNSSSNSIGGTVGYRFHWQGSQNSGFVGLNLGYYSGTGEGTVTNGSTTKTFDVDTSVTSITANIGKRWAWDGGLNITFRIGLGKGNYEVTTDSDDPDAQGVVELVDDLLTLFPIAFDGELSAGYIF